ncbi:MAG TPA: DUF3090 family protein [Candidatus Dormibacteraeota bacterium]|nr:DUF3090 family protein [Candidatus Dormibacteraeota bacterium]
MPRRMFVFDPPDRFVAGTVGQPGQRIFFLQARKAGQVVSVVLEKVQVAVLAERLDALLDELESQGVADAPEAAPTAIDSEPLDEPINEAFRATTLTLGWDADAGRVLVEARADPVEVEFELEDDDDEAADGDADDDEPGNAELEASIAATIQAAFEADDDDGPDVLRVRMTADHARSFVERAARIVASGRPPCPLCGQPLDPQGHICPRRNGHYVN